MLRLRYIAAIEDADVAPVILRLNYEGHIKFEVR